MKDVKNFEGLYGVTEDGQVFSYRRNIFMKQGINNSGYSYVKLSKKGTSKTCYIHRLVAEAYIPNPENKAEVNHIDENKQNNSVSNLEWMDHKENMEHGTRGKRQAASKGIKVYCAELKKVFESAAAAKRELGVDPSDIGKCCKGLKLTAGGYHWTYANPVEIIKSTLIGAGLDKKYDFPGIYCIKINQKIVYVGKSRNMLERIATHIAEIQTPSAHKYIILNEAIATNQQVDFDVLYYSHSCGQEAIDEDIGFMEGQYIRKLRPVLNYQIPKLNNWRSFNVNKNAKTITLESVLGGTNNE